MRGAAFLSGRKEALVIDVGGTTSDIGTLQNGFPREADNVVHVGGVRTLLRMPDLISIGLGGGTMVDPQDPTNIGPLSIGNRIAREAVVVGGNTLTCTDIAVAAGLVAVGGGAFLVPDRIAGISRVIVVPWPGVANAVGAAMAQVSGEVDQIFQAMIRDEAIAEARRIVEARACAAGADPRTLTLVEVEDLPIAYMPSDSSRVRLRVAGAIAAAPQPGVGRPA